MTDDEWLTTGQAAELLGVTRWTIRRYIEEGLLESTKLPSGHNRIRLSAVLELRAKGQGG